MHAYRDDGVLMQWNIDAQYWEDDFFAAYIPTLSELIEAFGEHFSCVHRLPDGSWRASLIDEEDKYICGEGSTPDEAVARLWLALHANGDASA